MRLCGECIVRLPCRLDLPVRHARQNGKRRIRRERRRDGARAVFGLDFGYTPDPTALFCGILNLEQKTLHVFAELYRRGLTNMQLADELRAMHVAKERIIADCAEPKSIEELRLLGISRIERSRKGPDSIRNGIDFLQNFEIIIHPSCTAFLHEIENYVFRPGAPMCPAPSDDHLMDAMRYAVEPALTGSTFSF